MALQKKTAKPNASTEENSAVLSFALDEMDVGGGLLGSGEGFDATIRIRAVPWDYNGNSHTIKKDGSGEPLGWHTAAEIEYTLDDGTIHYDWQHIGDINIIVPCNPDDDGDNPVELPDDMTSLEKDPEACREYSGVSVCKVDPEGKKGISQSSKWAEWLRNAVEAEYPAERLKDRSFEQFDGLHGHFSRVKQETREGLEQGATDTKRRGPKDILVLTQLYSLGGEDSKPAKSKGKVAASTVIKKAAPSTTTAKKSAKPTPPPDDDEDAGSDDSLESRVAKLIVNTIREHGDGEPMPRKSVYPYVVGELDDEDQGPAFKLLRDDRFHAEAEGYVLNIKTGMLSLEEE